MGEPIPYDDWIAEGKRRFGDDSDTWAFVCPACKCRQTVAEMKAAGVPETAWGFSCIGRWDSAAGCNYAGGGLFKLNPVTVERDGKQHPFFAFAELETANAD